MIYAVDTMKKNKDNVTAQLTDAEMLQLCQTLAQLLPLTGAIAIAAPMDTNTQMSANGTTCSPRTAEAHIQKWCDTIHGVGLKVIHRGTFSGCEAIWGFPYYEDGSANALPIGTSSSAPTDGETTWCGRIRRYILTTVGSAYWSTGDIFAPIPEATSHAFDGHAFWEDDVDSTTNYANAFIQFKATADAAFSSIGKTVSFESYNNYSEVASGWLPTSLTADQGVTAFDYYGRYQGTDRSRIADWVTDLNTIYTNHSNKPLRQGEFGAIAGEAIPNAGCAEDRLAYLIKFYQTIKTEFIDTGKMTLFNYWGGWEAQNTSILYKDASNNYQLNAEGKIFAAFAKGSPLQRVPVIEAGTATHNYRY